MKTLICIALLYVGLVCCATPPRPKFPEVFQASFRVETKGNDPNPKVDNGVGMWAVNQPKGMSTRDEKYPDYIRRTIQRYDMNKTFIYRLEKGEDAHCNPVETHGTMPDEWGWLADANYTGPEVIEGKRYDVWEHKQGAATLKLGVTSDNEPGYFGFFGNQIIQQYFIDKFSNATPSATVFAVPATCTNKTSEASSNAPSACIAGSDMVKRAQVWVTNKVPYNQGATYMGYREDCSGYVSYCWASAPPGHVTSTMHQIATQITKAQLQPGDCLLYAAEHVVLFGGWTDSSQTHYTAFEETRPGEGTVSRPTPYPYWYSQSDFIPFRYNNKC